MLRELLLVVALAVEMGVVMLAGFVWESRTSLRRQIAKAFCAKMPRLLTCALGLGLAITSPKDLRGPRLRVEGI